MQRRSFFSVLFGGLAAVLPHRPRHARYVHDAWFKGSDPRYRFGFSGFKPADVHGTLEGQNGSTADTYQGQPRAYVSYPMEGGFYKPGDTFAIGRRRTIVKVD